MISDLVLYDVQTLKISQSLSICQHLCSHSAEAVTRDVQMNQVTQAVTLAQVADAHLRDGVVVQC